MIAIRFVHYLGLNFFNYVEYSENIWLDTPQRPSFIMLYFLVLYTKFGINCKLMVKKEILQHNINH